MANLVQEVKAELMTVKQEVDGGIAYVESGVNTLNEDQKVHLALIIARIRESVDAADQGIWRAVKIEEKGTEPAPVEKTGIVAGSPDDAIKAAGSAPVDTETVETGAETPDSNSGVETA